MTKTVVFLSDCHVGSRFAVSPLSFEMSDGSTFKANAVQRALYHAWIESAAKWVHPDILVINGEPIDGQGPKTRGVEQWTTNYLDQIDAAAELIRLWGAKKIFLTTGSGYHVEQGGVSVEEIFGAKVKAEKVKGRFATDELLLEVEDVTFNVAHHIASSISGWNYRSTPIAKEMMLGQLVQSHKWPFDVLVRSHVHYYWAVESAGKLGLITPAWELQTPFMKKKGTMGSVPDIGAVRFTVEGKSHNHEKLLYRLEEARPSKVKA